MATTARHFGRTSFLALAAATVVLGLCVHAGASGLGPVARDVLGDALWAMMMSWWIGAVAPRRRLGARSAVAIGICVAVELSQLVHCPLLDAVRATTIGHLVLGSGFDPRDLVAYLLGVGGAALLERAAAARGLALELHLASGTADDDHSSRSSD